MNSDGNSKQSIGGESNRRKFIAMAGTAAATAACASSPKQVSSNSKVDQSSKEGLVMAPSVKHVVFMKFKEDVSKSRIEEHKGAVIGLNGQIPVMRNIEFGADFAGRAEDLTHCIIVTLSRPSDIEAYLEHPAHVPVAEALVADLERLLVMDVAFGI